MNFAYENLEVWNKSVDFAVKVIDAVEKINTDRKHYRLLEQIEASSTSIAMNIAEGKGRFSNKAFISTVWFGIKKEHTQSGFSLVSRLTQR